MNNSATLTQTTAGRTAALGPILREWRAARRMSQMDLALEAGISTRHLSFVETGRSAPSRDVVVDLATALDLTFRQRNTLLQAAGYAPEYGRPSLDSAALAPVRQAIERHLAKHEPYPAVAVNPAYDILLANEGFRRATTLLAGPDVLDRYPNVYRLLFAPDGLQPHIAHWPDVRQQLLMRLRTEARVSHDGSMQALLAELESMAPESPAADSALSADLPVLTLDLMAGPMTLRFFSTITTLGTPLDVTTQEVRLESLFPADETTRLVLEQMGAADE